MSLELQNFDTEIKNINSWNLTYRQKAQIIYPANIKELQSIIKFCKKKAKTITIRTGKCSYDSKSIPANENCIIISLRKFNKITQINKRKVVLNSSAGQVITLKLKNSMTKTDKIAKPKQRKSSITSTRPVIKKRPQPTPRISGSSLTPLPKTPLSKHISGR